MTFFRNLSLLLCFIAGMATATAQPVSDNFPVISVGIQGGAQLSFTNFDHTRLLTPIGAVHVGADWTPIVSTRLHVSGLQSKIGLRPTVEYKFNFVNTSFDLLLNATNMFRSYSEKHRLNVYLIGGWGLNYHWKHERTLHALPDNKYSHLFRGGLLTDVRLTRNWSIGVELNANHLADRFNGKLNGSNDWQLGAMLGITYRFGKKTTARSCTPITSCCSHHAPGAHREPIPVIPPMTLVDTVEVDKEESPKEEKLHQTKLEVLFSINSFGIEVTEMPKIGAFADWIKQHPNAAISIVGYADAQTGNPDLNLKLSKERVDAVKQVLTGQYGISEERVQTDYKGDTIQPKSINEENRIVIGLAEETLP